MQLAIESFLIETLTERVKKHVRKVAKQIARFICPEQLCIVFPKDDARTERYRVLVDRVNNRWEWRERIIDFSEKKHGKVGSPVKMRKIIKDEPYLKSILD
jgi:hypothetical protein